MMNVLPLLLVSSSKSMTILAGLAVIVTPLIGLGPTKNRGGASDPNRHESNGKAHHHQ